MRRGGITCDRRGVQQRVNAISATRRVLGCSQILQLARLKAEKDPLVFSKMRD